MDKCTSGGEEPREPLQREEDGDEPCEQLVALGGSRGGTHKQEELAGSDGHGALWAPHGP